MNGSEGLFLTIRLARPGFNLSVLARLPPLGLTAVFGRSGAGKSTVLRAIAGLETEAQGEIRFNGTVWQAGQGRMPAHKRRIGYVFQDARLFPHMSVRRNLEYGLDRAPRQPGPTVEDVAALLGIGHLLDRRPATLSGGEAQRVAMGRAFLSRPQLLLMDEPLAALDQPRKAEILPYIEKLRDVAEIPILYVSHSVAEVARLANHIVLMEEGSVVLAGPAHTVMADPTAAPFFGVREAGVLIEATIVAHHADGLTELATRGGPLYLPHAGRAPGSVIRVRVLAQDVMIALRKPEGISALNVFPVTVTRIRDGDGPGVLVSLASGGLDLMARITKRSANALGLRPGLSCHAVLKTVAVDPSDIGAGADGPTD
jgi:molybdate transport system ATP-binding protein